MQDIFYDYWKNWLLFGITRISQTESGQTEANDLFPRLPLVLVCEK